MSRKLALTVFASAVLVTTAHAQVANSSPVVEPATSSVNLYTSPLYADNGGSYHACNIANIYKSPLVVTIQMFGDSSTAIRSLSNYTLQAGSTIELSNAGFGYTGFARCVFTVKSSSYVRANATVFHYAGSYFDSIAFSEAR